MTRIVNKIDNFIIKTPNINRYIKKIYSLGELEYYKFLFSKDEYYSLFQCFHELEIYNNATWEERKLLSPPLSVEYDNKNLPNIIFPFIEPLMSETEAYSIEQDDSIFELQKILLKKGLKDEKIATWIEKVSELCDKYSINSEDILNNLSNCGFSPLFGPRILDYGLCENFK